MKRIFMIRMVVPVEYYTLHHALRTIHESVLDRQIAGENDRRALCDLQLLIEAAEEFLGELFALVAMVATVQSCDTDEWNFVLTHHLAQVCLIEELTVILWVRVGCFSEIHENWRIGELLSLL